MAKKKAATKKPARPAKAAARPAKKGAPARATAAPAGAAGVKAVIPHLVIRGAAAAIAFYEKAFGASEVVRLPTPDGKGIWHATLAIGRAEIFVCDEMEGARSARALGGSPVWLTLEVADADAVFARAIRAGATVRMPLADMFWGSRYGQLVDPFGFPWAISQQLRDVSPAELRKASAAAAAELAK
jgi:uncharacterized glyoxalase superfamily protein PhnB